MADAEAEGWNSARVREHIKSHKLSPEAFAAVIASPDAEDSPQDDASTVQIRDGELARLVDACEVILARPALPIADKVFQRGGQMVRVAVLPAADFSEGVARPQGAAVIMPVATAFLQPVLSRHGKFQRFDKREKSWRAVDPPRGVSDAILARSGQWPFPALRGVVCCPTVRADGTLLLEPGYDPASGYYLAHDLKVAVSDKPSLNDAAKALESLTALLAGFSFVSPVDRSVGLALILTAVARPALDYVPLFSTSSPVRGSGKSTLLDVAAVIATGRRSAVLSVSADRDELEKRLVGCLLAGDALVNLDNVNGTLRSDLLCQGITAETLKVRPLGSSVQSEIPNSALWAANGNNLVLAGDLTRRALLIRLDPQMERPEERVFSFDPVARALEHRSGYVNAALTIVRGYVAAGRPDMQLTPFGSFERWSSLVRSALVWAGAEDPFESRTGIMDDDPEAAQLRTLLAAWNTRFGRTPRTVKEIIRAASEDDSPLEEPLEEIAGERGDINSKRLGRWLLRQAGRISGGLKLIKATTITDGSANWKVIPEGEA
ncbi:MAG: hypothetical protein HQK81_07485 [Desulfovibrionaceae bacterium]|nr:hypothetical protein [Desulfovibrionaceae bacterium]MBF0513892.1 hypothetical protein [Desulfovibrionaceae bacterium]